MQIDQVPFIPNAEDDRHCYPASIAMIVGHFVPELPTKLEVGNRIADMVQEAVAAPSVPIEAGQASPSTAISAADKAECFVSSRW